MAVHHTGTKNISGWFARDIGTFIDFRTGGSRLVSMMNGDPEFYYIEDEDSYIKYYETIMFKNTNGVITFDIGSQNVSFSLCDGVCCQGMHEVREYCAGVYKYWRNHKDTNGYTMFYTIIGGVVVVISTGCPSTFEVDQS